MATFTKRTAAKGVRWLVQVRCSGVTATQTFDTRGEGKRWADELERNARLADKGLGPLAQVFAGEMTFGKAVPRFISTNCPHLRDSKTVEEQLGWWRDWFGEGMALAAVRPADVAAAREELRKERQPGTVNRYVARLKRLYNVAIREWQAVSVNPAAAVSALREPGGRVRWLDERERMALLGAVARSPLPELRAAVMVSLCTAVRQGELLGLEWRDIDLVEGLVTVRAAVSKTNRARVVPIGPGVVEALRPMAAAAERAGARVFDVSADRLRRAFAAACVEAKVVGFRWHDLRHTAASYLAMDGASPREIAEITGHQTMAMVMRYTHMSSAHSRGLTDRLADRVMGKRLTTERAEDTE